MNENFNYKNLESPSSASTSKNSSALTGFDFFESFASDFSVLRFRDFIDFIEVFFRGDKLSKSFRACSTASLRLEAMSVIKSSKYHQLMKILYAQKSNLQDFESHLTLRLPLAIQHERLSLLA